MEQKIDEVLKEHKSMKGEFSGSNKQSLFPRTQSLEEKMEQYGDENRQMKEKLDELEQYSGKSNLIINGISFKKDENLREIVKNVAEKLKVTVNEYYIAVAHHLLARKGIPPIIAKFNNRKKKI